MKLSKIILVVVSALLFISVIIFVVAHYLSVRTLDKFVTVNERLEKFNDSINLDQIALSDECIKKHTSEHPTFMKKYQDLNDSYDSVKQGIRDLKDTLITLCSKESNYDTPTTFMIDNGNATILKAKISSFIHLQNELRTIRKLPSKNIEYLNDNTDDIAVINWEMYNFFHLPLAGVITNLSVIERDMRSQIDQLNNELKCN